MGSNCDLARLMVSTSVLRDLLGLGQCFVGYDRFRLRFGGL